MNTVPAIALLQATTLPDDPVADWVHLLPAGTIATVDGRGPYSVLNAAEVIEASFLDRKKLPIDENHAIDIAAPRGQSSPARGYVVELQAREDGIWGRVDWTPSGKALIADRAYVGISPAILHDANGRVLRILSASLVNRPNLRGLTALHHQEGLVTFQSKLAEKLGLNAAASEDDILAALPSETDEQVALQSALPDLRSAFGLSEADDVGAVLNAARNAARDVNTTMPALQAQVRELSGKLTAMDEAGKTARAQAFIDGEIKGGRMGLNAENRDEFVAMHLENPERTEKLVKGFAVLKPTHTSAVPPNAPALQSTADDLVGKARALQAAEAAKGNSLDWIVAVQRVSEAK
ncbi:phage protease [Nioella sp.]|uniref:phage protease n=1 Tax=Nioella sp. TaxID=1912091 RepID=UPI00351679A1